MTDASSLYGAAAELLAKSAAILDALPAKAPANQFVSHAPPAYDCCNTLTVHAGTIIYGAFRRGAEGSVLNDPKMHVVPMIPLIVTVLRCQNAQPQGGLEITLPTAAQMAADAQAVYADGWTLYCGLNTAFRDGSLFAGFPCRAFEIDGALPIAPQGGCLGWAIAVQVQLDGFDPVGA